MMLSGQRCKILTLLLFQLYYSKTCNGTLYKVFKILNHVEMASRYRDNTFVSSQRRKIKQNEEKKKINFVDRSRLDKFFDVGCLWFDRNANNLCWFFAIIFFFSRLAFPIL